MFYKLLALGLTALIVIPGGAHLFELPAKMRLSESEYFSVQSIYAGWALFSVAIFAAIAANQATGNWTTAPADWERLRRNWEYGHAANAVIGFVALMATGRAIMGAAGP